MSDGGGLNMEYHFEIVLIENGSMHQVILTLEQKELLEGFIHALTSGELSVFEDPICNVRLERGGKHD
jgi:hypothetical protein